MQVQKIALGLYSKGSKVSPQNEHCALPKTRFHERRNEKDGLTLSQGGQPHARHDQGRNLITRNTKASEERRIKWLGLERLKRTRHEDC
jgi:hypothetical protein